MQQVERVLFIDDEPYVRKAFKRVLDSHRIRVDVAADAHEAMALVQEHRYAVIATDLRIPNSDGLRLIRDLKPFQPDGAFLMVTGATELSLPLTSPEAESISQIIYKPWNNDELVGAVKRGVEQHLKRIATRAIITEAKILLVDHDIQSRQATKSMLQSAQSVQFHVDEVSRLNECLEQLKAIDYDAVVIDPCLSDARGLTVVSMIQATAPRLPIVLLSQNYDAILALQSVQLGAQDYLLKDALEPANLPMRLRFAIERKRTHDLWVQKAHHDALTGLPNRVLFHDRLNQAIARGQRNSQHVGLLFIDLDRFKQINDTFGHTIGDALLKAVAERLKRCSRQSETVAHLSGDEFTVILEGIRDESDAIVAARRIVNSLSQPFKLHEHHISTSPSIGVALYPESSSAEQLIKDADTAMYQAKRQGRNRFCVYSEDCAFSH